MAEVLPPLSGTVGELVLRGTRVQSDLGDVLLAAAASVGFDQVAEISMDFYDPRFELLESGLFAPGTAVTYGSLQQEISSVSTDEASDGRGKVTVKARARAVGILKRRSGAYVLKNVSPSEFVQRECAAAGIQCVVEPSARRKQVARDVPDSSTDASSARPSSWTTFERLARELGYVLFESGGVVYFGRPSWMRKRSTALALLTWDTGAYSDCYGVPKFTENLDSKEVLSAQVDVPRSRIGEFLPGRRSRVVFPAYGSDDFLVTALSFPITGTGDASVTVGRPTDPVPEGEQSSGGTSATGTKNGGGKGGSSSKGGRKNTGKAGRGGGGGKTLGDLLYAAGFRGEALKIACGVAIAESGGVSGGRAFVNPKAVGDVALQNSKWGPSIGIFQIRSLRNPGAYGGADRLRVRSKLDDALYNAKVAYQISGGGRHWGAWSTYTSGRYRAYVGRTNAVVRGWGGTGGGGRTKAQKNGHANTSPHGRKSAGDFVTLALRQVGDRYVYGAEASKSNPNPSVFDCSELVEWAAARVGVYIPDGSSAQMAYMRSHGTATSVATAIRTRGALLWKPGHIGISLGNGRTVEALNPSMGVRVMSATQRSFRWGGGGRIPGMRY